MDTREEPASTTRAAPRPTLRPARRLLAGVLLSLAAAVVAAPAAAQAPDRPTGPVKILVGFPPGGSTDIMARVIAEKMKDGLGVPVVVENRPGAAGRVAAEGLKVAPPDGNTIFITPLAPLVIAPLVYKKLNYDPDKDFAPLAHLANMQLALAVPFASEVKTIADLTRYLQANPTRANFGTPGAGSYPHFFGLLLGKDLAVPMNHVPYRGGAPLSADLAGNQITMGIDGLPDFFKLHQADKLRIIASTGEKRSEAAPNIPTFAEQGYPQFSVYVWFGAYAPAATPKAVQATLEKALIAAVNTPEVREQLLKFGYDPTGLPGHQMQKITEQDRARLKPIIESSGFTPEN